jgi:hypothetical protein
MAITKVLSHEEQIDMPLIALAVRQSVAELRDPAVLNGRIASAQADIPTLTNAGITRRITPPRGRAVMNAASGYAYLIRSHRSILCFVKCIYFPASIDSRHTTVTLVGLNSTLPSWPTDISEHSGRTRKLLAIRH